MVLNAYCIYDTKAKGYLNPWFMPNDDMALRAFTDHSNDLNTPIGQHPEDYILYRIGTYDNDTAELTALSPVNLAKASQVIRDYPALQLFEKEG